MHGTGTCIDACIYMWRYRYVRISQFNGWSRSSIELGRGRAPNHIWQVFIRFDSRLLSPLFLPLHTRTSSLIRRYFLNNTIPESRKMWNNCDFYRRLLSIKKKRFAPVNTGALASEAWPLHKPRPTSESVSLVCTSGLSGWTDRNNLRANELRSQVVTGNIGRLTLTSLVSK